MEQLLTYGLLNNELIHVSKVENGIACKCFCANCKHPLVAKNNPTNRKVAHFAHYSGKECEGAIETTLHILAKTILQKTKHLKLPKYHYDYDNLNNESIFRESTNITFENVILEKSIQFDGNKIIPDAICEIKSKQIYIEFANSHFVDQDKIKKLKTLGVACIEIDLSKQPLDEEVLTNFFNSDSHQKYWIINKKLDKEYLDFKKKLLEEKRLLKQQIIIKKQKRIQEGITKYNLYKNKKEYKLLRLNDEVFKKCPLKLEALSKLNTTHFYRHEVLKKIIDGDYWNGQLYGFMSNGKWIFVNQDKVIIYPSDELRNGLTEQEIKNNNLFFAGLQKIKEILLKSKFGNCKDCKFSVDYFSYEDYDYVVCKHPSK